MRRHRGNTIFPPAFPTRLAALARVALKRATEANYHLAFLAKIRRGSSPSRLVQPERLPRRRG